MILRFRDGAVAQLGERVNGIHEVSGSIPLGSTRCLKTLVLEGFGVCGCSSGVEHNLAKVGVEGSNPFARSKDADARA